MCEIDMDGERAHFSSETKLKARKVHTCRTCSTQIQPGTLYVRCFSVYDGHCRTAKMCIDCFEAWREFVKAHGGSNWAPDDIDEDLAECIRDLDEINAGERLWHELLAGIQQRQRQAREVPA